MGYKRGRSCFAGAYRQTWTRYNICFDNMVEELQKDSEVLEHDNNNIGETSLVNQLFIVVVAASFGFSLDSLDRSDSAVAPETNDKIKLLKKEERVSVKQNIDREAVVEFVLENTPKEFMPALFPDRMELWTADNGDQRIEKLYLLISG